VFVFARVDLPLDHLIRYFKPSLKTGDRAVIERIPSALSLTAEVEAVYFRAAIERLGGRMEAGKDFFFDADALFTPAIRYTGMRMVTQNVRSLKLDISSQEFQVEGEADYYEKVNFKNGRQTSTTKYLACRGPVSVTHPVVKSYSLGQGVYRIIDVQRSSLREDNFGINSRNVKFDPEQWKRLVAEI
jgi:hypothetical protein